MVAKSITLKDKFKNLGAQYVLFFFYRLVIHTFFSLVQDVVQKTNEVAGDGTTTTTMLAHAIYSKGVKNVAAGCNLMDLHWGSQGFGLTIGSNFYFICHSYPTNI